MKIKTPITAAKKDNKPELLEIKDGWLVGERHVPSPNFNERPLNTPVSLLVIHNISLPPSQFDGHYIEDFFCNKLAADDHPYFKKICDMQVSAHCLIKRSGELIQFVNFAKRAWHAGKSQFNGEEDCNNYSIGIELEGTDHTPYTEAQYAALVSLSQKLLLDYPLINLDRITGHEHIAPGRKTDPGPSFDWQKYKNAIKKIL